MRIRSRMRIELQNAVAYGLTAGLYTQNPDDLAVWLAGVEAGNLYVNRGITGRDRAAPAVRRLEALIGRRRHEGGRAELPDRPRIVARHRRGCDRPIPCTCADSTPESAA